MPRRVALKGWHGSGDSSCSAAKPNSTLPHSASTPATTTASARDRRSQRSACAKALALDEQAVDTVAHGPCSASACCTKAVTAWIELRLSLRSALGKPPSAVGTAAMAE